METVSNNSNNPTLIHTTPAASSNQDKTTTYTITADTKESNNLSDGIKTINLAYIIVEVENKTPTITNVTRSGNAVKITGTNFVSSSTTVTYGASTCSSVSVSGTTSLICAAPEYGYLNSANGTVAQVAWGAWNYTGETMGECIGGMGGWDMHYTRTKSYSNISTFITVTTADGTALVTKLMSYSFSENKIEYNMYYPDYYCE